MALKEKLAELRNQSAISSGEDTIREWKTAIDKLFVEIERYLRPFVADGSIKCLRVDVQRSEETLGSYDTQELHMDVQGRNLVVSPIGRRIVGADGRVDLYRSGRRDDGFMLIWNRESWRNDLPGWSIVRISDRRVPLVFTAPAFEAAIESLID